MKTYGGFFVSRVHQLSGRVLEKLLKESGVEAFNGPQGRILYVLWEYGQLPMVAIGKYTSLAKTALTSMIDRMEEGGLVKRSYDRKDRRQILVAITEKAKGYRDSYRLYEPHTRQGVQPNRPNPLPYLEPLITIKSAPGQEHYNFANCPGIVL